MSGFQVETPLWYCLNAMMAHMHTMVGFMGLWWALPWQWCSVAKWDVALIAAPPLGGLCCPPSQHDQKAQTLSFWLVRGMHRSPLWETQAQCLAPKPTWAGYLVGRAKPHRQPPFGPLPQPQKWCVNLNFDSRGEKQLFAESCLGTCGSPTPSVIWGWWHCASLVERVDKILVMASMQPIRTIR